VVTGTSESKSDNTSKFEDPTISDYEIHQFVNKNISHDERKLFMAKLKQKLDPDSDLSVVAVYDSRHDNDSSSTSRITDGRALNHRDGPESESSSAQFTNVQSFASLQKEASQPRLSQRLAKAARYAEFKERGSGVVDKQEPDKRGRGAVDKQEPDKRGSGVVDKQEPEKEAVCGSRAAETRPVPKEDQVTLPAEPVVKNSSATSEENEENPPEVEENEETYPEVEETYPEVACPEVETRIPFTNQHGKGSAIKPESLPNTAGRPVSRSSTSDAVFPNSPFLQVLSSIVFGLDVPLSPAVAPMTSVEMEDDAKFEDCSVLTSDIKFVDDKSKQKD
jgi:hypothetical protein